MTNGLDREVGRIAGGQHGAIGRWQALDIGMTAAMIQRRLTSGRWVSAHVGSYVVAGAPATRRQEIAATVLACGRGAVASHATAAELWGFEGIGSSDVHVSVPDGRRIRRRGIVVHRPTDLDPVDVCVRDSISVTSAVRTLIDITRPSSLDAAEDGLDDALRRGLFTLDHARRRATALARPGRPGAGRFLGLVEARDPTQPSADSVLEREFERLVVGAGLPRPVRQHPIVERGKVIAVSDFAYTDERIAIWVDGGFHGRTRRRERDAYQRSRAATLGWLPLVFTATDIRRRPRQVPAHVAKALGSRTVVDRHA